MALTTTQVNTAFLAALARPAEGSAATWGAGSLNLDSLLNNIFIAENTEDFVESLYTEFLGRASDAEGKAFWNSLLATTSKEAVLAQFKAAILAAGQADPSNADYQGLIATNKAFVQTLYTNLLGREADAEGLDFWANALTSGTSRGDLLAQFTAAAMASGADNDDYQAITAKLAVADAFSAKFSAFNADVTADEKKAALDALKAMMEGVVAGSTVEDVQEEINQIAGNYQNRTSQVFTKANDDDLDASEATAATTFRGTVNLIDPAKGTIQDTDKVTGNTDFDDTLVVNVTSDSTHKLLDLNGDLPTVSDIEKLIVNNGSANVEGDLNDANFGKSVSITGTGDVNLKVNSSLENLSVSSATKGDVAIAVDSALGSYTGGNAGESVTVNVGGSIKKASLGAGDDTLVINGDVLAGGAIDLGAGNDELVINSDIGFTDSKDKITLDGGAGSNDRLTLNGTLNLTGVKSIKGFETIDATNATISAEAANGLKAKFENGSNLVVSGDAKATTSINLSGLSVVDKGNAATVTLNGLTKETITLSKDKGITENIEIFNPDVKGNEQVSVTIKNFAKGDTADKLVVANGSYVVSLDLVKADKIDPSKATQALKYIQENVTGLQAGTNYVAINTANGKASYVWKVDGATATRDNIKLVATVDKALATTDFIGGDTPVPSEKVDTKDYPVTGGELDLSTVVMSENKAYVVELSTNPKVDSITSVKLPAGINATEVTIVDSSTTAKPAGAVAVSVPADATITTLKLGSTADTTTQYNVTVAAGAQISTIVTNNADNNINISALPAGTVKVVNAGEGIDTLTIGGEAAADGFTMTGVEKLAYTGTTINSDAIFANTELNKTLELINESGNANKKLIVKAGTANDGNVDLSSLVNTEVAGKAATIEVTGVLSGKTVTLSSGTAAKAITETVTLGAATNVTIANAAKGDNISSDNFAATVVGNGGNFENLTGAIADTKAYFVESATATDFATAKAAIQDKLTAFTNVGQKAIVAVNGKDAAYVFAVTGAAGGATAENIAIVNGQKFTAEFGIQDSTITIGQKAPIPQPTSATLVAEKLAVGDFYKLSIDGAPLAIDKAGAEIAVNREASYVLDQVKEIAVNVEGEGNGTVSFNSAVSGANAVQFIELQGTGTRTVDLKNVNATAVKFITDGAANTTLDISGKTFGGSASGDQFLNGLDINLGEGTDVVVLKGDNTTYNSGDFTLAGVEGIKVKTGAATLDADLVTKVASGAVTTDLTQIEGDLTLQKFAAATTSIDLSNITKATGATEAKLTLDLTANVTAGNLTSVKGSAETTDTLVVSGNYAKLDTIEGIDALTLKEATTLKAGAITTDTLAINGTYKLTVNASGATTVDLANLSKGAGTPTIDITNVGSGATITLSKTTAAIAEDVKTTADATSVSIYNFTNGDKVTFVNTDLTGIAGKGNSNAMNEVSKTAGSNTVASGAAVVFNAGDIDILNKTEVENAFKATSDGIVLSNAVAKAVIAVNNNSSTAIYLINSTSGTSITADELTLLATLDVKADKNDTFASSVFTAVTGA